MANMIKFYRGLVNSLPTTGENGSLYITTDEGAIYYGTGTGMKRLGDFVQVDAVANLPESAHEGCLYYCVAENILAKWNGTEWKQINKQPTAEEMKTLLGLGSMAYKSEVAEGDLNSALAEKINASTAANHTHSNKALLDTYTQTEADLADAVTKKHAHANADELAKIADGDKAKWDAVAADYLTSADKTTLENSIKEAKKAGTDANTALESYKVTNDAAIDAIEEDIAEITDETNGILAQAKTYADGKDGAIAAAKKAGDDAQDAVDAYIESNDTALAGVKATAEAAATKTYTDEELAKKVDKVEGKSLIADSEIARLANVTNYDDTKVKEDIAKKADSVTMTTELGKKVDKVAGYSLVADDEIARLAEVDNYDDAEVRELIGDNADAIDALAGKVGSVPADKTVVQMIADAKSEATYDDTQIKADIKANADAIDAIEASIGDVPENSTVVELIANAQTAAATIHEELSGLIADNAEAIQTISDDYLKASDKEDLQTQINTIMSNPDAEGAINSINEFTQYVKDHGTIADGMRNDINKNKEDITALAKDLGDHEALAAETYETKEDASAKLAEAKEYADGINTALDERIDALEAINHEAYTTADATLKAELQAEIDADVKVVNDSLEAYKTSNNTEVAKKANAADVYAKTETYTQAEVDALIEQAHTWGEF